MPDTLSPATDLLIAGLSIRTTNAQAFEAIPSHWGRYMADATVKAAQLAAGVKTDASVYAVYCDFDGDFDRNDPGQGDIMTLGYRLVIGVPVEAALSAGSGLDTVRVKACKRRAFAVPTGQPQQVGAMWQQIWADAALVRAFDTDFERYDPHGDIGIHISVR